MRNKFSQEKQTNKTSFQVLRGSSWLCKPSPWGQSVSNLGNVHFPCWWDLFWSLPMVLSQLTVNSSKLACILWDPTGKSGPTYGCRKCYSVYFEGTRKWRFGYCKILQSPEDNILYIRHDDKKIQQIFTLIHQSEFRGIISL